LLSGPAVSSFVTPGSNTLTVEKIFVTDFQGPVFSN
jgi:hypothetical protein